MWRYNNIEEMYHTGVIGMRWGRRKRTSSEDHLKTKTLSKKKLHELSNKELQEYNNRKNLERNYNSFKPQHIAMGLAAAGTAVTALSHYSNLKKNIPVLVKDGMNLVSKFKNRNLLRLTSGG